MPRAPDTSSPPIRVAVIGCGAMGRRHIQASRGISAVNLSAVFDSQLERTVEIAKEFDVCAARSLEDIYNTSDAVVIATSTPAHASLAIASLKAGLHCLVEKPLATSETDCRQMIDTAAVKNLILQVGHVERFNPAVEAMMGQNLESKDILSIAAQRMNPASGRVINDDVVLDLMVHDLDLILALKNSPVAEISAQNIGAEHSKASLIFADSTTATVEASRTAPERARTIEISVKNGTYGVDFAQRSVWTSCDANNDETTNSREALPVEKKDPLQQQLAHFVQCVRDAQNPRVSGEQALATMKVAWRIQAALKGNS